MGDLSYHFDSKEFACKCGCGEVVVEPELIKQLERLRTQLGKSITITSGYRCPAYNATLVGKGAVSDSEHTMGEGVDIHCSDSTERYVILGIVYFFSLFKRIGIGNTFLHLGVSTKLPACVCWDYYK